VAVKTEIIRLQVGVLDTVRIDTVGKKCMWSWAEGGFGEPAKKLYWKLAGKKALIGAIFIAVWWGLDFASVTWPEQAPWAKPVSETLLMVGGFLAAAGLIDGGVRAPWPKGTDIPDSAKKG